MPKGKTQKKDNKEKETTNIKIDEKEFEEKVLELAKKGLTAEKIGEDLRKHGIHPKEHTKISRILKGKGMYVSPEIKNITEKLERIEKHKAKNIQDKRAMRERERVFSLLRKQKKYHNIA